MNPMRLIIDVGGTKTLLVATDKAGNQLAKLRFLTNSDFNKFLGELTEQIDAILKSTTQPLEAVAVAMPGTVDTKTNLVTRMGHENWLNVDIVNPLKSSYAVPVFLENDANMAAMGEAKSGAGKGYKTCLYLTISTGVGGGVTENGRIVPRFAQYEPWNNLVTYDNKSQIWDNLASGSAFVEAYGSLGKDVPAENPVWQEYAEKIAVGLKPVIAECRPDVVVIGGSMGANLSKYHGFLVEALDTSIPVVPASQPSEAVINGGIEVLREKLDK